MKKLPPRQDRFVLEYLKDLNATQACIRAGYSEKTAHVQGPRLLGNVRIAQEIQNAKSRVCNRLEISAERVLTEMKRLAFSNMKRFNSWGANGVVVKPSDELDDDDAACIQEVSETTTEHGGSLKIKLHDKLGALRDLAKYTGVLQESPDFNLSLVVNIAEVADFYGNANRLTAAPAGQSIADSAVPCEIQISDVRTAVGENGHGPNGKPRGPRAGPETLPGGNGRGDDLVGGSDVQDD